MRNTEESYYQGYRQGRFDEYADRMGHEQAKKLKKIEKQKNCPYCHSEKPLFSIKNDEVVVYVANSLGSQVLAMVYDFSPEAITDEDFMNARFGRKIQEINYCPMCGRPLRKKNEQ